jgi:exonuclease SbcC
VIRRTDQRLSALKAGRDRLRATIDAGARQLGLADSEAASQALAAAKSGLEGIGRELRVAHDKEAVLRSTQEQLRSRRRVYEKHRALHGKVQTDLAVAVSRENAATAQLAGLGQAREKLGIKLSIAFACMPDLTSQSPDPGAEELGHNLPLLDEDCEAFRRIFGTQAEEWKAKTKLLEETRHQATALEAEIEYRERDIAQAAAACAEAQTDLAAKQQQAIELAEKRSQLFEGSSVSEVRLALDQQVEVARQNRRSAELRLEAANVELMRLETTIGSDADSVQTNSERLATRQAALDRKLKKRGLTEEDARQLASRGEEWCRQTSDAISDFENQRARASERLKERTRQLSTYERTRPERNCEDVERLFQEIAGQRKELDFLYDDIKIRLADAQSAEDRIRALTERLVAQEEEGRVWVELGELIGSADGKAFRNFAQRYTLQLLLEHANDHLADLKPRYRLEKCPDDSSDPLGILIVDQDMGDERRPVTTLSEGETFLVSLALALGLASLQARNVRLESLFIDEGLGTLDSASLETVLAALEALQIHNRQVGVISHVEGLADYFPAEVRVVPLGMGASRVEIADGSNRLQP